MVEPSPGDWVRFYVNGMLIIAEVEYITHDSVQSWRLYACTDRGQVEASNILELRRQIPKGTEIL
jgi:hypothetical protein